MKAAGGPQGNDQLGLWRQAGHHARGLEKSAADHAAETDCYAKREPEDALQRGAARSGHRLIHPLVSIARSAAGETLNRLEMMRVMWD